MQTLQFVYSKIKMLESDKPPSKCVNLRWQKKKGKSIPHQCNYYCEVKQHCPYQKDESKWMKEQQMLNKILF